jgi:hypothetical protein
MMRQLPGKLKGTTSRFVNNQSENRINGIEKSFRKSTKVYGDFESRYTITDNLYDFSIPFIRWT